MARSGQNGTVELHGRCYRMKIYKDTPDGRRVAEWHRICPLQGHSRAEAKRKAKEMIAAMGINTDAGIVKASKPIVTFDQAVKGWESDFLSKMRPSSQNSARYITKKHLLPRFGEMSIDDINAKAVRAWITDLDNAGELVPKSIHNVWKVLKLILEQEEHVTRTWKLNLPQIPYKEQRWFRPEEVLKIVAAAKGQYKVLYYLLGVTGLRAGEAFGLHISDIWFDRGLINCHRSTFQLTEGPIKTKAGYRNIPLNPEALQLLRDHLVSRTSGRVFQTSRGTPLTATTVNVEHLRPLLKELTIPHGTLHSFRHGRVSHLRRQGVPDSLIKKWVGHSSLRMTDVYTHYDADYEQKVAAECGYWSQIGQIVPIRNRTK
ncbi:MAG: tyrosine-type recombinase/integrase [Acidobacteriaceae bacterium]